MLPTIGIMVGLTGCTIALYVIARSIEMRRATEDPSAVKVFAAFAILAAVLTILFSALGIYDLFHTGTNATP